MNKPPMAQELAGPLPSNVLVINDDREAQLLALFYNATDELRDAPEIKGPRMARLLCDEHPTHWILFSRAWGHKDPKENGWNVVFVPKVGQTREEMQAELQRDMIQPKTRRGGGVS